MQRLTLAKSAKIASKLYYMRVNGSSCGDTMRHTNWPNFRNKWSEFLSFKVRMVMLNITMRVYLLKQPI